MSVQKDVTTVTIMPPVRTPKDHLRVNVTRATAVTAKRVKVKHNINTQENTYETNKRKI